MQNEYYRHSYDFPTIEKYAGALIKNYIDQYLFFQNIQSLITEQPSLAQEYEKLSLIAVYEFQKILFKYFKGASFEEIVQILELHESNDLLVIMKIDSMDKMRNLRKKLSVVYN